MDNTNTECTCNHLTHFAVLMQFDAKAGPGNDTITKVGSSQAFASISISSLFMISPFETILGLGCHFVNCQIASRFQTAGYV